MGRYQKFNKFFDSISLRYLFQSGESYEFMPRGDGIAEARLARETRDMSDATFGVSGNFLTA